MQSSEISNSIRIFHYFTQDKEALMSLILFLWLLFLSPPLWASEHRLAVLDVQSSTVQSSLLLKVSDQIRLAALDVLPKNRDPLHRPSIFAIPKF